MSSDQLTDLYKQLCRKHNIEIQECVQEAFVVGSGAVLDLATQTLDVGTCAVLGKIMQMSQTLSKVSFEDCLLREECTKSLLLGLCGSGSVRTLSLKGNAIQATTTTALAKMLRHNRSIVRLSLEWNNLGLCPDSFASFCEALGTNSSLQYLDLRSNQLASDAATHLAEALASNCALLTLDVRWNNLGASGGKALLSSLRHNTTLTKLSLTGNSVPADVTAAIEAHVAQTARGSELRREYTSQADTLRHELEKQQRATTRQMENMERSLMEKDRAFNSAIKESKFEIGRLEEELRSRTKELEALVAKYELVSSALRLSQERISALEATNTSLETELRNSQEAAQTCHKEDREALEKALAEHIQEVRSLQKTITHLEAQVGELEFKCENQRKQILDYKENMCALQSEVKAVRHECDEMINSESLKHKEGLKQQEQQHNAEVVRLTNQHQQTETELREALRACEAQRSEAEAEVAGMRLQLSSERSSTQTQLHSLKQQLKAEHSATVRSLEERLEVSAGSLEEAQDRIRTQAASNATLTTTNARLSAQLRSLSNDLAEMRVSVEGKESEVREAERRVREEIAGLSEELRLEREQTARLKDTIVELKRRISELEGEKDQRIRDARAKEEEARRTREDEARRAALLHSAFLSYFNSSPAQPLPHPPSSH